MRTKDMFKDVDLWAAIVVQLIFVTAGAFLLNLAFGWAMWAWITSTVIWTLILCFTKANEMWFGYVRENYIVVLADPSKRNPEPVTHADITGVPDRRSMRAVIGPRVYGKNPRELIVQTINTAKSIPIGTGMVKAYTKNMIPVRVKYKVFLTPIKNTEGAVNLARHTWKYVSDFFAGRYEGYIEGTCTTMTDEELLENLYIDPDDATSKTNGSKILKKGFNNLFWGKGKVHPVERQHGVTSGDPVIDEIIIDEEYQKSRQGKAASKNIAEATQTLKDKGIDPDVAANIAAQNAGLKPPVTVKKFIGLGGAMQHFVEADTK